METMYFVSWYIHNKTTGEWNATIVDKYDTESAARKSYHNQLSMYIDDPQFDSVAVMLTDSVGNVRATEFWREAVPPTESESEE